MKKLIIFITLSISINCMAQDTTIATLSIKARLVETLERFVRTNSSDTAYSNLLYKWQVIYRNIGSAPPATQLITVDSVPINVIVGLYSRVLSYPQGTLNVSSDFSADIAAIRGSNNFLDRLLDDFGAKINAIIPDERKMGRRDLLGRGN